MEVEPTQSGIAKALKRWSSLRAKKARIEAERDEAIAPHRAKFEQRCAPINARAQERLTPVEEQLRALEAEITLAFMVGVSENGDVKITRVNTAAAYAEVLTRQERELDPQLLFESVPASQRGAAFWSCLKTMIGKAEKFLGADRLNTLAHAKRTHTVSINELKKG